MWTLLPCRAKVTSSLATKITFIQISPTSFSPPTDVTLKLSDGSIDAHKMILAAVSPVFERMFYGNFKEGQSKDVDLPKDSYKTMRLLIDTIYKGSCEVDNLDDTIPLMEVMDRYQINKVPLKHMCGEPVLSQLDSSNYLTLLPKYVSVMSEESHKKAADKVMSFTNNDFVTKFDETKDLPEEVMLPLLKSYGITQPEINVFEFLVKWHNYQTKDLGMSLQLTTQLFQCVRYFLILPQLLSSKVIANSLADRQLVAKAFDYLYNSPSPLGSYGDGSHQLPPEQFSELSSCSIRTQWISNTNVSLKPVLLDRYDVSFYPCNVAVNSFAVKSMPLSSGMHSFCLSNLSFTVTSGQGQILNINSQISIAIFDKHDRYLDIHPVLCNDILISLYIHDDDLFVKFIEGGKVKSTTTTSGESPFVICICNSEPYSGGNHLSSFSICHSLN